MFEVADLAVASPATVSRCGMVYLEPSLLGISPFVECYLKKLYPVIYAFREHLQNLFDVFLEVMKIPYLLFSTYFHSIKSLSISVMNLLSNGFMIWICQTIKYLIGKIRKNEQHLQEVNRKENWPTWLQNVIIHLNIKMLQKWLHSKWLQIYKCLTV